MMQEIRIEPKDISLEASLLSVMSCREIFEQYNSYVDYKRLLPDTERLLKDYKKYYSLYPEHGEIDWTAFYTQFSQNWHTKDLDEDDIKYYREHVFPIIRKTNRDESILLGIIQKHVVENITNSKFDITRIRKILDSYEEKENNILQTNASDLITIDNVDFTVLDKSKGVEWFLPSLQESLGSMTKGQLIVIPGDVGTGKSAFVISQVAHAIRTLNQPIIYFNSEGTSADVFMRICSNLFHREIPGGFESCFLNAEKIRERFRESYGSDKLFVKQMNFNNIDWLRASLSKFHEIGLIVIDITDNLAPEEDVQNLKKVFDKLRVLSGMTCPILATTQAGNQTYFDKETNELRHRERLGMSATYGSKTGKGGAADTMITIGMDNNNKTLRHIEVPKKKRGKSVSLTVELIEEYSLYRELVW